MLPLALVKEGIAHELAQKNIEAAIQSVLGRMHSDLNEDFFAYRSGPQPPPQAGRPANPSSGAPTPQRPAPPK